MKEGKANGTLFSLIDLNPQARKRVQQLRTLASLLSLVTYNGSQLPITSIPEYAVCSSGTCKLLHAVCTCTGKQEHIHINIK